MRRLATLLALALLAFLPALSQTPPVPGAGPAAPGLAEVLEAIARARVCTRILYVTAHPDDESSTVLTYLARGLGADVALLAITRGEGGQNAIGPEYGAQLAAVRSEELLAATRTYGTRLFFTRAPDFGYSKSTEETMKFWGAAALDDMVQVIRAFRPHIVVNHWAGVRTGHGHHQTAGLLTPQAVAAAADPQHIPLNVDVRRDPWKVGLLLQPVRGENPAAVVLPAGEISPLWGRSYAEIGRDGFLNHRTQGIAGFLGSPFVRRPAALVRSDGSSFDLSQLTEPLAALGRWFPAFESLVRPTLEEGDRHLLAAGRAARELHWIELCRALAAADRAIRQAQSSLRSREVAEAQQLAYELSQASSRIDHALVLATGLRLEASAERAEVVAGQSFTVRVEWRHRAGLPLKLERPRLHAPKGWTVAEEQAEGASARFRITVPPDASWPQTPDGWMLPWPLPLVAASLQGSLEGYPLFLCGEVRALRASSARVETVPLALVPAVTMALQPRSLIVRSGQPLGRVELLARAHHFGREPTTVLAGIEVPAGWRSVGEQRVEFAGEGDALLRFVLTPPAQLAPGTYQLKAYAKRGEETFRTSLEPLPSLPSRLWAEPAEAVVRVLELNVPPGLQVGYVAAENDPIPSLLAQLGVHVELLDEVKLAFADLGRFDAIAVGIRAYELRRDLVRANRRLLDYAAAGGTLVVQYQREGVWNSLRPAPYPAEVGGDASVRARVTDEHAPVRFVAPAHPLLNFPNRIVAEDFSGWVQERGLYFWGQFDQRYQPILALRDPGEEETLGSLVCAQHGKGLYIYTGLAFFRQLPAGVPGAYRLFVNLLSQSRAKAR